MVVPRVTLKMKRNKRAVTIGGRTILATLLDSGATIFNPTDSTPFVERTSTTGNPTPGIMVYVDFFC